MHVHERVSKREREYSGFSSEPEDGVSSESAKRKEETLSTRRNAKAKQSPTQLRKTNWVTEHNT